MPAALNAAAMPIASSASVIAAYQTSSASLVMRVRAAAMDGAGALSTLWHVTLPLVRPAITICTFLTLTNSFKLFDYEVCNFIDIIYI